MHPVFVVGVISIHAPREGSDLTDATACKVTEVLFLSTLPARGATCGELQALLLPDLFLSTLPARGATLGGAMLKTVSTKFLSTLPARGATIVMKRLEELYETISIHAPREGSDDEKRRNDFGRM